MLLAALASAPCYAGQIAIDKGDEKAAEIEQAILDEIYRQAAIASAEAANAVEPSGGDEQNSNSETSRVDELRDSMFESANEQSKGNPVPPGFAAPSKRSLLELIIDQVTIRAASEASRAQIESEKSE